MPEEKLVNSVHCSLHSAKLELIRVRKGRVGDEVRRRETLAGLKSWAGWFWLMGCRFDTPTLKHLFSPRELIICSLRSDVIPRNLQDTQGSYQSQSPTVGIWDRL